MSYRRSIAWLTAKVNPLHQPFPGYILSHYRMHSEHWYVYIVRCADGSLYTGVTTDLERRLAEHNSGRGAAYTRSRAPVAVVYSEEYMNQSDSLKREAAIKRLTRIQKERLVIAGPQ